MQVTAGAEVFTGELIRFCTYGNRFPDGSGRLCRLEE